MILPLAQVTYRPGGNLKLALGLTITTPKPYERVTMSGACPESAEGSKGDLIGVFYDLSIFLRVILRRLYLIRPVTKVKTPIGTKHHPMISMAVEPKKRIKVTPATNNVSAVRM